MQSSQFKKTTKLWKKNLRKKILIFQKGFPYKFTFIDTFFVIQNRIECKKSELVTNFRENIYDSDIS